MRVSVRDGLLLGASAIAIITINAGAFAQEPNAQPPNPPAPAAPPAGAPPAATPPEATAPGATSIPQITVVAPKIPRPLGSRPQNRRRHAAPLQRLAPPPAQTA